MGGSSWQEKIKKAKRLHRPSLKDWECDGLYETFPDYVKGIVTDPKKAYQSFRCNNDSSEQHQLQYYQQESSSHHMNLPVVLDAKTLSPEEFFTNYEATEIPCIIQNASASWPATKRWSLQALEQDEDLVGSLYKCGEDDNGKSIKVKLRHFLPYLHINRDDSPLYIFDSAFDEDRLANRILSDYQVPCYFSDDLFRFISESRRPPYRWFLVGPERSGTTVHIDPLGTSAWNTLVHGQKRWVLFPPHVPKHIVKGKGLIHDDEDDEAIHYFMTILPRIKRKAGSSMRHGSSNSDYDGFACYEFTQNPGETVFIPTGWWHAVLNLTHTVGVTQNYCSPRNFKAVWLKTRSSRKKLAWKWLCQLDEHYPHLADMARQMNQRDGFRMKYDPAEIKRREEEEQRRRKLQRTV